MISFPAHALIDPRLPPSLLGNVNEETSRLSFTSNFNRLNHGVFRFPAKFHPPVVRELIERFSRRADTILDPFCGSGTTIVEALVAGRGAVGTDVDPLSVLITRGKTQRYDIARLEELATKVTADLVRFREADERFWGDFSSEIDPAEYAAARGEFAAQIPDMPNIEHWFRRRVIIQLAAIKARIDRYQGATEHLFFQLCFGAIIRNSSNADPVPVSGLEVTRHMREREIGGRVVDPYSLLTAMLRKTLEATRHFQAERAPRVLARAAQADARYLSVRGTGLVDCVITSPPYLTAVNYYRRHLLEMFWLGLTDTVAERLELMRRYLGRDSVAQHHIESGYGAHGTEIARRWLTELPTTKPERARAFTHYCAGMSETFARLVEVTQASGPIIIVIGDVRFNNQPISMPLLLAEIGRPWLHLGDQFWYSLANRHMSYERKNGANIDTDHVLVFRSRS